MQLLGDRRGLALDLHLVDDLLDHAPALDARGLAAELDRQTTSPRPSRVPRCG